jgi:hypothetical protein
MPRATLRVALLPQGHEAVIWAADFDPTKHALWDEWQQRPADGGEPGKDADPGKPEVATHLGRGWYSFRGRKVRRVEIPPDAVVEDP